LLHRLPDEIDSISYEDAIRLLVHCDLEREELDKRHPSPGGRGGGGESVKTERTVYKQRRREPPPRT
jgi:hypothetical protein